MRKIGLVAIFALLASISFTQEAMDGITGEGKMKDGHKVGKWNYTCESTGKEIGKESYDGDGLKHGYQTWHDCEGNILSEYNYEHGKRMGTQKEYYNHDRRLKREWSMIERPKKCRETKADKDATDIEWYNSFYENGKPEIVWQGDPCGERKITKFRSTNGTEWILEYDDEGNYKFGPRDQERKIKSDIQK